MLSRLSCLICCGASPEARNSSDVVAVQAGDTRANDEGCDELTSIKAAFQDGVQSDFARSPEDCRVREVPSPLRKTQKRQNSEQGLETSSTADASREPSALHAQPPKPSMFSAAECMPEGEFRAQPRAGHNLADADPLSGPEEGIRPSTTSTYSFIEPHSPFVASAAPAVSPRGGTHGSFQQQQSAHSPGAPPSRPPQPPMEPPSVPSQHSKDECPSTAFPPPPSLQPPPSFLCAAGSGMQPLPPRHLASIISSSTDMQITASLSEPLVTSCSPGSGPPANTLHACGAGGGSSSAGTAVTAFSAATQLQPGAVMQQQMAVTCAVQLPAAAPPPAGHPKQERQQQQQQGCLKDEQQHGAQQQQQQQQQQLNVGGSLPPGSAATVAAAGGAGGGGGGGGGAVSLAGARSGGGGGGGALYPPYVAARGSLRAGSESGSMVQRVMDDTGAVQLLAPYVPYPLDVGCSTSRLPKQAARDMSQVALMQMLHFGSTSGRVPLQHLASLNVTALSKEIRALHWIGQGGGGAVFQGVWQGAPVAVKFMLAARPEHVDATALEAIVSLTVGHPNVVTTYSFDVTRLTESSFMSDAVAGTRFSCRFSHQHLGTTATEDCSATALFNALMETETALESWTGGGCGANAAAAAVRQRQQQAVCTAAGGGSRPASMVRVESLNMRVRRAQAAAALASGSGSPAPSAEAVSADRVPGDGSGGGGGVAVGTNSPNDCTANGAAAAGAGAGVCASSVPATSHKTHQQYQHQNHNNQQQQQQQHPHQGAAASAMETLGLESAFNSEEGFGDPDLADSSRSWTVRHVLSYLKGRPGMYMTHIIMEYCDRGSLLSAIKRGVFKMDGLPDDDTPGSSGNVAAAAAGTTSTAGLPEAPRFTKRVVLRALLRTARDVAQGMCHLHSNGIIHGDLKPGNVLLRGCRSDRRGFTALVSDFGLSKITRGDKPLELNHWSTVTVMAPEVIMGRWLKASDVFSFGILLWQLVTGEIMPYGNATVQQVLLGVAQGVLKPEWPSSAHPALVRLGRACLATSPEKRPSFEAIVKILIKVEQNIRNELRPPREALLWSPALPAGRSGSGPEGSSSRQSRSSPSENTAAVQLNRLRSAAI
ncbi:hypothetical protein VOLCADRAFT_95692 [Volvox carteri f. nagariensis]|uniref:Protein kinase domain-containing protein n=1 Tax=Volvox carteri f. nagariensis TaxID=3068 RepID=D8U850_VOLCA|nr:uncharacterized protein VOLCADRAFT_95692 [Volvox carteri f. nagariensis]EFJ44079.1 hypothetical protein VOLCADRAFT_95692 [Volvox carteri f. nagariensis]|eukprot:XP_002954880.1 hypothetical protein VOLCADRAFT_95692 [Volvox carteri f. nagariensis]